jgi:NitT/TauT family transport system permease protein
MGRAVELHAEVLKGAIWHPPRANWRDLVALALIVVIMLLIGSGARQMLVPIAVGKLPEISLSPSVGRQISL